MALTIHAIQEAESNEEVLELLTDELQRLLPEDLRENQDLFRKKYLALPRGLRAMAGMHFFSVSMTLDDLAWHFANQNDAFDLRETLDGLRELELVEVAKLFEEAWTLMEPHLDTLRSEAVNGDNFYDWLVQIGLEKKFEPMNEAIWSHSEQLGEYGLLEAWAVYAKKFPERCVAPVLLPILPNE
jgi:hypothetical protein